MADQGDVHLEVLFVESVAQQDGMAFGDKATLCCVGDGDIDGGS